MNRAKTLGGLSLLCALVFSAVWAGNAMAVNHTTAFTCDPNAVVKEFKDQHCDELAVPPQGIFGHTAIPANMATEIVGSKNRTSSEISSWLLNVLLAGTPVEFTCNNLSVMATIENNTTAGGGAGAIKGSGGLEAKGGGETAEDCKLLKPESQIPNCTVTVNPAEAKAESVGMGIKFAPKEGTIFTRVVITDAVSPPKRCKVVTGAEGAPIGGSATATGIGGEAEAPTYSGATLQFTKKMTEGAVTFAGNPATLEGKLTLRMGTTASPGGSIAATTVP